MPGRWHGRGSGRCFPSPGCRCSPPSQPVAPRPQCRNKKKPNVNQKMPFHHCNTFWRKPDRWCYCCSMDSHYSQARPYLYTVWFEHCQFIMAQHEKYSYCPFTWECWERFCAHPILWHNPPWSHKWDCGPGFRKKEKRAQMTRQRNRSKTPTNPPWRIPRRCRQSQSR